MNAETLGDHPELRNFKVETSITDNPSGKPEGQEAPGGSETVTPNINENTTSKINTGNEVISKRAGGTYVDKSYRVLEVDPEGKQATLEGVEGFVSTDKLFLKDSADAKLHLKRMEKSKERSKSYPKETRTSVSAEAAEPEKSPSTSDVNNGESVIDDLKIEATESNLTPNETPLESEEKSDNEAPSEERGFFGKIADRFNQRGGDVLTSLRSNTIDLLSVSAMDKIIAFHDNRSKNVEVKRDQVSQKIKTVEASLNELNQQFEKMKGDLGKLGAGADARVALDAQKMRIKIRDLSDEKRKMEFDIASRDISKVDFQKTRDSIATETIQRIENRLKPHVEKLDILNTDRKQLETEIVEFDSRKSEIQAAYYKLKEQRLNNNHRSLKKILKDKMNEVEEQLKLSDKEIEKREKELKATLNKIKSVSKPIDNFNNLRNKFTKHSPDSNSEKTAQQVTVASESSNSETQHQSVEVEKKEELKQVTPLEFLASWNKTYGSRKLIDQKQFVQFLKDNKQDPEKPVDMHTFSIQARAFVSQKRPKGFASYDDKNLQKEFDTFDKLFHRKI